MNEGRSASGRSFYRHSGGGNTASARINGANAAGSSSVNGSNFFDHSTNGNSIQFSSSTGTGGTWQRTSGTTNNSSSSVHSGSNGSYMSGYSMMGGLTVGSNGIIAFKCPECSITKNCCDELEIHIKTEHLNWLPFRCIKCSATRASDSQIREHMMSVHKSEKSMALNNFFYVDNPAAKRELQIMLDRALLDAAVAIAKRSAAQHRGSAGSSAVAPKRPRLSETLDESSSSAVPTTATVSAAEPSQPLATAKLTVLPRSNTSDILAQIQAARNNDDDTDMENGFAPFGDENGQQEDEHPPEVDDQTNHQLSQIFGANSAKNDYDEYDDSFMSGNGTDKSLMENISAFFNSTAALTSVDSFSPGTGKIMSKRAPRGSRQVNCVSKKRVLGECSRCQKPVTAGARQMHMFYHLGKDYNTYRFKCKFDDCEVEHYRKDQMENHQSKQHGRIDPDMMEDRSLELAAMVQQLSMELLGTSGNTPGPTAERAQIMYNNMQREAAEAATKKKRRFGFGRPDYPANGSEMSTSPSTSNVSSPKSSGRLGGEVDPNFVKPISQRNEEFIKCMMCGKTLLNRVRGFHLLWHLNNDLGIIRYCCKFCDYKHDRHQSVATHGKREHNSDNCVEDSIYKYEEEIKSTSRACYGVEQTFTKEWRKKKADESVADNVLILDDELDGELDENEQVDDHASVKSDDEEEDAKNLKLELKSDAPQKTSVLPPLIDKSKGNVDLGTPTSASSSSATKKKSTRRFGMRRPKSKKQKREMAKLREISMALGGAQYFRKKINESAVCEKCGKPTNSRLSHHAYGHLDVHLFQCPECELGHQSRDLVVRHMKDLHSSTKPPIDNRLKYAHEIKEAIRECYPDYFVDAPIPTMANIDRLKKSVGIDSSMLGGLDDTNEDNVSDGEDQGDEHVDDDEMADQSQEVEEEDDMPHLDANVSESEETMDTEDV